MLLIFAILSLIAAVIVSFMIIIANGMRSSPGPFKGGWQILTAWAFAALLWSGWFFGW